MTTINYIRCGDQRGKIPERKMWYKDERGVYHYYFPHKYFEDEDSVSSACYKHKISESAGEAKSESRRWVHIKDTDSICKGCLREIAQGLPE